MILKKNNDTYNIYDYEENITQDMLNNKLFCTFSSEEGIDFLINDLKNKYSILYNKIFVLEILDNDEYVVTYNIEEGNINTIPNNTILVHRKKESNTLYTINALNQLIKKLNNGYVDNSYRIEWKDYQNSILLTQHNEFTKLNTKIHKIISL